MPNKSQNTDDLFNRKGAHIRLSQDPGSQGEAAAFNKYHLPYNALPEFSLDDVDTSFTLCGKELKTPMIIASMTGGSKHGRPINTNLAKAAEACGIAIGVGSQRIGLEKPDARSTFELVREHAPNAFIVANIGAVQLNYGHGLESCLEIIKMVDADALYLHINPLQEALQPGGDTDYRGLLPKIEKLISQLDIPVFVKEVGHGISGEVAHRLYEVGAAAIDIAGVGGTSYAWIEAQRANNQDFADWFKDIGIPTDQAIQEIVKVRNKSEQIIIASGGIRNPVDGLKARALGADMFSAAIPFLKPAIESPEAIIATIQNWQQGLRIAMFAAGVRNWDQARSIKLKSLT